MVSYLHREDFNLGPGSCDEIEKGLFLGDLATAKDISKLNKMKISHILTIDTCPLPRRISDLSHIETKFVPLSDLPKEDLLSHFDDTCDFIQRALDNKGAVLVHCYFGVSRSASVVIAYMMKKYSLPFSEAMEKVKMKRSIVYPNEGFVLQLKIYKDMGYKIDHSHTNYKAFRLSMAADRVRKAKILPQEFMNLIQPDPGLPQAKPESRAYRCKKCRRVLATEQQLAKHSKEGCNKTHFIEPIAWMNVTQNIQGKLHCPKCQHKVGSFSWVMGCQCPCGVQVAPAFYLVPSKVDYTEVVKNVEMTF